jgi:hypothetical protein
MTKNINKFVSLTFFLLIVGVLFLRQPKIRESLFNDKTRVTETVPSVAPSAQLEFQVGESNLQKDYQFIATNSGQNALELVESQVKLDLKEYDFGTMIEGVNGLMADNKNYWAVYQNGEYAQTGIAQIELQKNDKIELKYEEITY